MPELPPNTTNPLRMFITSSFLTKPVPLPESVRLEGETAIVTGSNVGIGLATVELLLKHGLSRVIMAVRSLENGETAADPLRKQYPDAKIEVWALDMHSYESIQQFAQRCDTELSRLDKIILNAGIAQKNFVKVEATGHEEIFQVNYLSTALLAFLILPILKKKRTAESAPPARLTFVTSTMAFTAKLANRDADPFLPSFDDGSDQSTTAAFERYSASKLMVLFLTRKLGRINSDKEVIINVAEPGMVVGSSLARHATGFVYVLNKTIGAIASRSLQEAAYTYTDALCVKESKSHGCLVMNWEISGYPVIMYGEEGEKIGDRLWKETLAEFSFANVAAVVDAHSTANSFA